MVYGLLALWQAATFASVVFSVAIAVKVVKVATLGLAERRARARRAQFHVVPA
jgi:hypothetical protein